MSKVYLHIGLPKTGAAAIQYWLTANAPALRGAGVFTFQDATLGHRLAFEAMSDETRENLAEAKTVTNGASLNEVTSQLANVARDKTIQSVIVSSEYFTSAEPARVKQLLLDASLEDVSIIVILRRQDRFIEANYGQGGADVGDSLYQSHHDWHALTRAWADAFSPDALLLHTYEKASVGGQIVKRVIGSLDNRIAAVLAENPAPPEEAKEILSAELLEFKRLADRAGAPDISSFLERAARAGIGGTPFRMGSQQAKSILDVYRESNMRLARAFFSRNGDLFDESDLREESKGTDCTGNLPVETVAALLALHVQEVERVKAESAFFQRWLRDAIQSGNNLSGWVHADLLSLKENIKNQFAHLPERMRHEAIIAAEPLYREVQALGERLTRVRANIGRLEDLTSPKRMMQIGWNRLTARLRRT